ncbi:ATP-binding protein [Phycisphaerales bacterium]|nr:ATP-binding protein [Phycisphaerales bacterium]RPG17287.1 MAG: response regulator [Phycisphaera sp. TMED9]
MTFEPDELLAPTILDRAFPFHFGVAADGRVVVAGPRLSALAGDRLKEVSFFDLNAIETPLPIRDFESLRRTDGEMQIVNLPMLDGIRLRGEFIHDEHSQVVRFLGHPWITDLSELEGQGLGLQDFPANAGVADLLVLLQAKNNSVEDMRRLADRLRDASSELEGRNHELERELKARADLEAQLLQSQKMEAIGQLASGVAHDFNNVLLAISGHATLGASAEDLTGAGRHFDAIQEASGRAADITARLLVFARRRRLEVGDLDLVKAIEESRALFEPLLEDRVNLAVEFDPEARSVRADPVALQQLILNLVVNARDAMPKGGSITIRTRLDRSESPVSMFGADRQPGTWSVIEIEDDGVGIDAAALPRIFEPFFTTKDLGEGTGLGLSTVWWIVERCSGVIDVRTRKGEGTTISVHLPSSAVPESVGLGDETPSSLGMKHRRMLLVEDDDLVRPALAEMLEIAGWSLKSVSSALEALEALQKESVPFDVLVTDLSLVGMTGLELARRVETRYPGMKTILISGSSPERLSEEGEEIEVLTKPFTIEQLEAAISKLK